MLSATVAIALLVSQVVATVNNMNDYNYYAKNGANLPYGYYTITNVGTGDSLYYARSPGQNLSPQPGPGSLIELQPHNASTNWFRIRPDKSTKCVSAQWDTSYCNGTGCDWAGVLYNCIVDPAVSGATLAPTKQWYIFNPLGTTPESYNIVAVDHLKDMKTRAFKSCVRVTGGPANSTCLEQLDVNDNEFAWTLSPAPGTASFTPVTTAGPIVTSSTSSVGGANAVQNPGPKTTTTKKAVHTTTAKADKVEKHTTLKKVTTHKTTAKPKTTHKTTAHKTTTKGKATHRATTSRH